nr:MAG TPA: hypothetical protein [Caudoviricetes sp.]
MVFPFLEDVAVNCPPLNFMKFVPRLNRFSNL